jgi:hypothetical protein
METDTLATELVVVARSQRRVGRQLDGRQCVPLLGRDAARGQPGTDGLELRQGLEHLDQPAHVQGRHDGALARRLLDQPGLDELQQRLAHRRTGHRETLGDRIFVQGCGGRQATGKNILLQCTADDFALGQLFGVLGLRTPPWPGQFAGWKGPWMTRFRRLLTAFVSSQYIQGRGNLYNLCTMIAQKYIVRHHP